MRFTKHFKNYLRAGALADGCPLDR